MSILNGFPLWFPRLTAPALSAALELNNDANINS